MMNKKQYIFLLIATLVVLGSIKLVIHLHTRSQEAQSGTLFFIHPAWKSRMEFVGNNRLKSEAGDFATILEMTDNTISINWDKYGRELYQREKNGFFYLKNN